MSYKTKLQNNNSDLEAILDDVNNLPDAYSDVVRYGEQTLTEEQKAQARENIGALSEDDVDAVLAQAKESGEFDGTSVTVESVTESMVDGGGNVVTFSDGTELTVWNGRRGTGGPAGKDGKSAYQYARDFGYTGTQEEFSKKLAQEIPTVDASLTQSGSAADAKVTGDRLNELSEAIADLPNDETLIDNVAEVVKNEVPLVKIAEQPVFVDTVDECTDPEKAYVLPDGYIYTHGTRYVKNYTNLLPTLTDKDGNIYNGVGYKDNTLISYSTGLDGTNNNYYATGYIPVDHGDVVRLRGMGIKKNTSDLILFYDKDKNKIADRNTSASSVFSIEDNGDARLLISLPDCGYVRFTVRKDITPDFSSIIITVNEEIIEGVFEGFYSTGLAYQPTDYEPRIIELEEDVAELKKSGGGGNVTFDYTAYGLPELALTGNISGMSKDNAVTLDYVYGEKTGTCTVKWQGSSSISYPKKNYTVKFDNAFEAVEGWGEQKKYCLKANYIDHSHARNIVSARLWAAVVRSRSSASDTLKALYNCGAIDGFPCVITINGEYQGLYTFNIPKDGWMFGMGSGTSEAIICAENDSTATRFASEAVIGTHFSLEYVTDEDNADWVGTSINRLINACINSDGTDLDTTIAQYLDWDSAIDYYIFVTMLGGLDMTNKNYLLVTYDGTKWFFSAYDMDSTYGLYWNGKRFESPASYSLSYYQGINRLMNLLYTYKKDALKTRYTQLRKGALSEASVINYFTNFVCKIPERIYLSDTEVWPTIPSSAASNLAQITTWYQTRAKIIDAQMEAL